MDLDDLKEALANMTLMIKTQEYAELQNAVADRLVKLVAKFKHEGLTQSEAVSLVVSLPMFAHMGGK